MSFRDRTWIVCRPQFSRQAKNIYPECSETSRGPLFQSLPRLQSSLKLGWIALLVLSAALPLAAQSQPSTETIQIDLAAPSHPLSHFWEQMFGSGRAILSLRDSYRRDLREVKQATNLQYIRFHAIFHDEVGLYDEDATGKPLYNFSYVDQIYDGLLQNGVRPFVELSFMPRKLGAQPIEHSFWYHPIIAPPKDWNKWSEMITQFTQHLVARYGIDEVSQWYFEVWNEPNLDFWAGVPKEATYYQLYDTTARAIKAVNPRMRVGGPSTAQAAWVDRFIKHVVENNVPVDFVSSHVYGNDEAKNVLFTDESVPRTQMVCRAAAKVHDQVKASSRPDLPIFFTEYNASYKNEPDVTDAPFMGPWLADTIRQCDGLIQIMSYWTFSDVFEEQGVVKEPFYGGFGVIAEDGIPKPAFNAFKLLHELGDQRIGLDSKDALVTRRSDGTCVIAVWNLLLPEEKGEPKNVTLELKGIAGNRHAMVSRVDATHGSPLEAYAAMGRPADPTSAQIAKLRQAAQLPPPEKVRFRNGALNLVLPPQGLALVEVEAR
jgi:xylan 1,4-beta-xylosidase